MIIKILKKSAIFKAVRYNTDKMDDGRGELLRVRNFGALQGIPGLRPQDYIHYLETVSARSKRIQYPQLHATISAKGRSYDKEQLAGIAEKWMDRMGYGNHPYLLIFHKDTKNNHIHIVSTRIGRDGIKVKDSFEHLKAYRVLNGIIGVQEQPKAQADVEKALAYRFSTRAQFQLLLEQQGYAVALENDACRISKFGKQLVTIPASDVDTRIAAYTKDKPRIHQLRQIIEKYGKTHDARLRPVREILPGGREGLITGYTSDLFEMLREKFGLVAVFHFKAGKPPYGYTWIDHAKQQVLKGGDIRALGTYGYAEADGVPHTPVADAGESKTAAEYMPLPGSIASRANPDGGGYPTGSRSEDVSVYEQEEVPIPVPDISIADDIDDEAILGRNRRRKKQARTNTR